MDLVHSIRKRARSIHADDTRPILLRGRRSRRHSQDLAPDLTSADEAVPPLPTGFNTWTSSTAALVAQAIQDTPDEYPEPPMPPMLTIDGPSTAEISLRDQLTQSLATVAEAQRRGSPLQQRWSFQLERPDQPDEPTELAEPAHSVFLTGPFVEDDPTEQYGPVEHSVLRHQSENMLGGYALNHEIRPQSER